LRDSLAEAKKYALKLINYRPRSKREIIERLKGRGFSRELIGVTVEFLEKAGLINDRILAPELFRSAVEKKCLGRKGIEMFLSKRGVGRELINEVLSNHTIDLEKEAASRLVKKKLKTLRNYPQEVVKRRLCGMLQRRGFSSDVIRTVVKDIF
jgi:regulatory protein